jgi:hypothetical protein
MNYCAGYIRQQENQQLGIRARSRRNSLRLQGWSAMASQRADRPIDKTHPMALGRHRTEGSGWGMWPAEGFQG